ncbi:hypothetical protein JCM8547_003028 [Rhodosporidiobolus lusitaniae]
MPLSPPTPCHSTPLPRTPPPKRVSFLPTPPSSSSFNLDSPSSSPALPAPPAPSPPHSFHRFRRTALPLHLKQLSDLDQLLLPSPDVLPTRTPFQNRTNALPGRRGGPTRADNDKGNRPPALSASRTASPLPQVEKKTTTTTSTAVQTSPAAPRVKEKRLSPPTTGFVASLRSSSGSEQDGQERGRRKTRFSPLPTEPVAPPSPPLSPRLAAPSEAVQLSSPPAFPSPTSRSTPPRIAHPAAPPPPVLPPSLPRSSPPPSTPGPLDTTHLAPFRYRLDGKSGKKSGNGGGGMWVELLPSSSEAGRGGGGGDIVLDSREKDGRVWVFSSSFQTVTLFCPPLSPSPSCPAPLILLNPLERFTYAKLLYNSTGKERSMEEKHTEKAYKAVEKVLRVVRSRTTWLSFPHFLTFSPSRPPIRAKLTLFSDSPSSPVSFSLTFSLPSSSMTAATSVGIYLSRSRDLLVVSLTFPPPSPSSSSSPPNGTARTERFFSRLSSLSPSSSLSRLRAFLATHLSPTPSYASNRPTGTGIDHVLAALSYACSSDLRKLVERARTAHLGALYPASVPPHSTGATEQGTAKEEADKEEKGSKETRLLVPLRCLLNLPLPPPSSPVQTGHPPQPSPPPAPSAPAGKEKDAREEERRCLPGLGWVVRRSCRRPSLRAEKEEEQEEEVEYETLFADGERVVLRVWYGYGREGGEGEEEGLRRRKVEKVEWVEVEDARGRR